MEALWSRFIPSYNKVREDIKKGVIGDVLHSEVTFGVKTDHVERVLRKELGGGNALDTGIYTANWSQFVHGSQKPKRVCSCDLLRHYLLIIITPDRLWQMVTYFHQAPIAAGVP